MEGFQIEGTAKGMCNLGVTRNDDTRKEEEMKEEEEQQWKEDEMEENDNITINITRS